MFEPIKSTKKIVEFYRRYLLTTFQTDKENLNKQLAEKLNEEQIAKGPFISISDSYQKGVSINELIKKNTLSHYFANVKTLHPDRPLYKHQIEAITKANNNQNLVVTTGTGSGKTECFLIPVIQKLLKEKEELIKKTGNPNAELLAGVRTLIIYPLNALVNDQIGRLVTDPQKSILQYLPEDIKVGMYTGETPEEVEDEEVSKRFPNLLTSRKEMRDNPPQILITNYAMLEYLLLRPDDCSFFDKSDTWTTIVLDEAHIYEGAKGIEVSTLLRRVKARINKPNLQFILTSATLGSEKDNDDIIHFANSLCSCTEEHMFTVDSIIRSKTQIPQKPISLNNVSVDFYTNIASIFSKLNNSEDDEEKLQEIFDYLDQNNYISTDIKILLEKEDKNIEVKKRIELIRKNIGIVLYHTIIQDYFYWYFRDYMFNSQKDYDISKEVLDHGENIEKHSKEFLKVLNAIQKDYKISKENLINFIMVASMAENETADKLFEAKYHMFLKGFDGFFVTLKPNDEKIFLYSPGDRYNINNDVNDKNDNNWYKIFEISFCANCNALYIIGKTDNKDKKFEQKSYYDEGEQKEIYLISVKEYDDNDEENEEENEEGQDICQYKEDEYWLCTNCGKIEKAHEKNEVLSCKHNPENKILIKKVLPKVSSGKKTVGIQEINNKLYKCPCCHTTNPKRSIIRPYSVGQLTTTSVIATALYNELSAKYFEDNDEQKQFLAFSDSRQKAAAFATNLDDTYKKYLIKRIIVDKFQKIMKDDEYKNGIAASDFADELVKAIKNTKIYEKKEKRKSEAYKAIVNELVLFSKKDSMLNMGFFYFDINFAAKDALWNLTKEETTILHKIIAMGIIKKGAIGNIDCDGISASDYDFIYSSSTEELPFFKLDAEGKNKSDIYYFRPQKNKKNNRIRLLEKLFPNETTDELRTKLKDIWDNLKKQEILINEGNQKYRIDFNKIFIKPIKHLYICNECKTITPYNLKNICPKVQSCSNILEEYDYQNILKDNHYRNLFLNLEKNNLIAKEHTAQLSNKTGAEYQEDFKTGKINVLSCSTTFEMGVDLGSLDTVFMRNMPPTSSNYTQRAGRAGRSANSVSYALTYCLNSSHDIHYFEMPTDMIDGIIYPPIFDINNEKIILRHIFASALSFFWKQYPDMYKNTILEKGEKAKTTIGYFFTEKDGYNKFKEYILNEKPENLKHYLQEITKNITDIKIKENIDIENFGWAKKLFSENSEDLGILYIAKQKYDNDIEALNNSSDKKEADENTIKSVQTISFLSQNNVIPKYGFPVDIVELENGPKNQSSELKRIELSRDLYTAITEYAPDSKIIANGMLCTSRYVKSLRLENFAWPKFSYKECEYCHTLNISSQGGNFIQESKCNCCKNPLFGDREKINQNKFIIPKFGFIMGYFESGKHDAPEEAKSQYPEKTYSSDIYFVSNITSDEPTFYNICENKQISIISEKNAQLAILNTTNFYICPICGFAMKAKKGAEIPEEHKNPQGDICKDKKGNPINIEKNKLQLGHTFYTDAIVLRFNCVDIPYGDKKTGYSILYSLLEGLSKAIPVNRKEIDGCLYYYDRNGQGNYCFVLFDKTPGGAGYVRELKEKPEMITKMLQYGYNTVKNCSGCDSSTSCYACLRNYNNQKHHDYLKRDKAIAFYEKILGEHTDFSINLSKNTTQDIVFQNIEKMILNVGHESDFSNFQEIIAELEEDYIIEDEEKNIYSNIDNQLTNINYETPFLKERIKNPGTNEEIKTDFLWKKSKTILFLNCHYEEYQKTVKINSDWSIFCWKENLNISEFINKIKEK